MNLMMPLHPADLGGALEALEQTDRLLKEVTRTRSFHNPQTSEIILESCYSVCKVNDQ